MWNLCIVKKVVMMKHRAAGFSAAEITMLTSHLFRCNEKVKVLQCVCANIKCCSRHV